MANCTNTSIGKTPLFPGIMVPMPEQHLSLGIEVAGSIIRLNPQGQPANNGRRLFVGLGMSNAKQQFAKLMELYRLKYGRQRPVSTVNLGTGNWALGDMVQRMEEYKQLLLTLIAKKRTTPEQVQIALFKNSIRFQDKPFPEDVNEYVDYLEQYRELLIELFPNLKMWFMLAPVYSGYASGSAPRHEPFVYREGIAVHEFIKRHYGEAKPWIGWGPYYWADGLTPRGDGLIWKCEDFASDGVHPSTLGRIKAAEMLLRFFEQSPVTEWFT